ncbi:MAG: SRPBCC domain-containing protein [Bacteroidetes bacterium]|nr:SRPBCC domain-containing protein [Bacteroidota bacterium]
MKATCFFPVLIALLLLLPHTNTAFSAEICSETEICTEIEIETTAEKIWNLLIDFERYPDWHTYLLEVKGKPVEKTKIKCTALNADSSTTQFSAYIQEVIPNRKLAWGGSAGFIFRASHYFILEGISTNKTRLIQGEYWKGMFGKSYGKKIYQETYRKFVILNQTLKLLLESESR